MTYIECLSEVLKYVSYAMWFITSCMLAGFGLACFINWDWW